MNPILRLTLPPAAFLAWCLCAPVSHAQATSRLSSRFLARGEVAILEVAVLGSRPTSAPLVRAGTDVSIRPRGLEPQTLMIPGRRFEHVFEYEVSSYQVGDHVIPAIEVETGGLTSRTEPLEFRVFNPDDLEWNEALMGNVPFRYASGFHAMNPTPYEGETTPTEIKLYIPMDLFIDDWGIPDLQREGLTAWRFQPSKNRGQVNLLGRPFAAISYPSTLTPTRTGPVSIGPARIRLISIQVIMDVGPRRVAVESNVEVPKLELNARPLPPGAPEGFANAVGNFRIATRTSVSEISEGDPVPVEIIVSGSGNLDALRAPEPVSQDGWKLYEAAPEQRGDERRELAGSVVFHQFLRPLRIQPAIPSFRLVYFDPKTGTYQTANTDPIPIRMTPAAALPGGAGDIPPAADVPVERMTDILGLVRPDALLRDPGQGIPQWVWHALGGLLALGLVAKACWMRVAPRLRKDPAEEARRRELRELERLRVSDAREFLMAAGRFVERWLGESPPDEARAVLVERDAVCFRSESAPNTDLGPKRRGEILRVLRRAVSLAAIALLCLGGFESAGAAETDVATDARTAYDEGRFDDAAALWLGAGPYEALSPDTLYNIGNACYRAGFPGQAALYYRRALVADPRHGESHQNLRFIERKHGSISVHRPEYQNMLAKLPLGFWSGTFWAGAWMAVLATLVFPATRRGARVRVAAISGLLAAPLLMVAGGFGWHYFPDDAAFAPLSRQVVVVAEDVVVHADAARTSPEVIDAPPGSLCELIRESGRWSYISFANQTHGWVPTAAIERVVPKETPKPPELRKPKADGKSA